VAAVPAPAAAAADGIVERERTNMKNANIAFRLAFAAALLGSVPVALAQKAYSTPQAAADAFVDAVARHDDDALKAVVGPEYVRYLPHADADDVTTFLEAWAKSHKIVPAGDAKAYVEVGTYGWTMPIPLVKGASGWAFDTKATPDELRTRRIGRNELDAIQVSLAITDAQDDYYKADRGRGGRKEYAQKLFSTPGTRDGLYWATNPGEPESPLGSLAAKAGPGASEYHGYHFRILNAQGADAPGGTTSYVANGAMTGGYAVVAWPVKWNDSGVMTFIVGKDKVVYEKDLGPDTDAVVRAMKSFNPDSSWAKVPPK
jgi:hypothetical protein